LSSLSEAETQLLRRLIAIKFDNDHKSFHVSERQALLKILIDYYSFHLDGFKKPKSLEVLTAVFLRACRRFRLSFFASGIW
jgi:DNA repair protein RecO (recombination protein O)